MHWLGGKRVSEYTNATHTQLLGVRDKTWSPEIFAAAGLELNTAPPAGKAGNGYRTSTRTSGYLPAFRFTTLIVPACHDTASAIAGIPAQGDDWGFISSGTWSLVGCVLDSPCVVADARNANFSNEGGVGNRIYFLKNVNGMWLLRQCIEYWKSLGDSWTVEELMAECAGLNAPDFLFDVDQPDLLLPGDMPSRINAQLKNNGRTPIPDGHEMAPAMANLIFHSLADRYAAVLRDAKKITGKPLKRLYIVGGGSKNTLLNQLTARATGLEVLPGRPKARRSVTLPSNLPRWTGTTPAPLEYPLALLPAGRTPWRTSRSWRKTFARVKLTELSLELERHSHDGKAGHTHSSGIG